MSTLPQSFKPVFKVAGDSNWYDNALRFPTYNEAEANAIAKFDAWTMATSYGVELSDDPPNYRWVDGRLQPIEDTHSGETQATPNSDR